MSPYSEGFNAGYLGYPEIVPNPSRKGWHMYPEWIASWDRGFSHGWYSAIQALGEHRRAVIIDRQAVAC